MKVGNGLGQDPHLQAISQDYSLSCIGWVNRTQRESTFALAPRVKRQDSGLPDEWKLNREILERMGFHEDECPNS